MRAIDETDRVALAIFAGVVAFVLSIFWCFFRKNK